MHGKWGLEPVQNLERFAVQNADMMIPGLDRQRDVHRVAVPDGRIHRHIVFVQSTGWPMISASPHSGIGLQRRFQPARQFLDLQGVQLM